MQVMMMNVLQYRTRHRATNNESSLSLFLRSLLPSFNVEVRLTSDATLGPHTSLLYTPIASIGFMQRIFIDYAIAITSVKGLEHYS